MSDIYNRRTDVWGGSFSADSGTVVFPRLTELATGAPIGADVGLLIQRLAMSYTQQISRLYEVGRPAIYLVAGRTAGDSGVDRVVGPRSISEAFYGTYGDVCRARENTLDFTIANGCGDDDAAGGFVSYICHFCVITTVGVNVGAADMLINESVRINFSSLLYRSSQN